MSHIELRGVRVHNLKNVDLDLPLGRLTVISGISGSGKSSLAFDTLYAEGQRRYIETFSPYARQFLDRLEEPDAERIDNIPPAIAIRQSSASLSSRSTVATATEIHDHLRLLFAKIGRIVCPDCRNEVRRDTAETAARVVRQFPEGAKFQICFPVENADAGENTDAGGRGGDAVAALKEQGFTRVILGGRTRDLRDHDGPLAEPDADLWVVVDRLAAGQTTDERLFDSLELAFRAGGERGVILEEAGEDTPDHSDIAEIDGRRWSVHRFRGDLVCGGCGGRFHAPEPRLFSFNTPLGACPECHGFGKVPAISFEHLVPDPSKSLREGAITAWTTTAYRHELDELLELANDCAIPVDVPFGQLESRHLKLIRDGVPERQFGGLKGFFRWLERHRYKLSVRVFLNRWRSYETCPACRGDRLQPAALAVRLPATTPPGERGASAPRTNAGRVSGEDGGLTPPARRDATRGASRPHSAGDTAGPNIAEVCRLTVSEASQYFDPLADQLTADERVLSRTILGEIRARLGYLREVGLGYLTLDRTMRTLSGGEAQRVALTATLGSSLVNTLYVLDEPSAGLHPRDSERVIAAIGRLRDAGNTVIVVEHEEAFLRAAEELVDIGPGAGRDGGRVVFQGSPGELHRNVAAESATVAWLTGRWSIAVPPPEERRKPIGTLRLERARKRNLKDLTVDFPLGLLCVVTGVSGSGKSTLVQDTLYPAVRRALRGFESTSVAVSNGGDSLREPRAGSRRASPPHWAGDLETERVVGIEQIDEAVLVDQSPIGRTPRSNPVTYMKAFDEIRSTFASTREAKVRNFTATQFSFNASGGGRCPHCNGNGSVQIDMQFLPDVSIVCPECHGIRFRRELLEVKYRGLTIADVLAMTVGEAFTFFRGRRKLQKTLQFLKDVGLDYLPLGQPATTLSGGESQRLKLASHLASGGRSRTLFLLDEPTTGLHAADVARLLACFDRLLAVGHSLIVIEHNLDVIKSADYVIDLGPEAGEAGGEIIARGTPEELAAVEASITGRYLQSVGVVPMSAG